MRVCVCVCVCVVAVVLVVNRWAEIWKLLILFISVCSLFSPCWNLMVFSLFYVIINLIKQLYKIKPISHWLLKAFWDSSCTKGM
jgi:hypothetical protein